MDYLVLVITPSVISSSPTPANLNASSSASSCNTVKTSSLGEPGMHTRAAVSTNSLPLGVSVEVDAIFELN